jgi:hypothetical protein
MFVKDAEVPVGLPDVESVIDASRINDDPQIGTDDDPLDTIT